MMKEHRFTKRLIFFVSTSLLAMSLLTSCSEDNDSTPTSPDGEGAKIEGKVTDDNGFRKSNPFNSPTANVEGAVVSAYRIEADGSLTNVTEQQATTDANGQFAVATNIETSNNIMLIAKKDNATWKTFVASEVRSGQTSRSQPMNEESSREAEVIRHMERDNDSESDNVTYAEVQAYIDFEIAAETKSDSTAYQELYSSIKAGASAKSEAMSNAYFGASSSEMEAVSNTKSDAAVNLQSSLYAVGNSDSEIESAYNAYFDAGNEEKFSRS